MNLYGYVSGDPINRVDPSGLTDTIVVVGHRRNYCGPESACFDTLTSLFSQPLIGRDSFASFGGGGRGGSPGESNVDAEACASGNVNNAPGGNFADGVVSGLTAPLTVAIHQNNLSAGNTGAIAVENAFGLALNVAGNNPIDTMQIAIAHMQNNSGQAAGRAIGSVLVGTVVGGGLGGRAATTAGRQLGGIFGRHSGLARGAGATGGAIFNFTISQQGGALQALYGLQSQANAAGIPFDSLSIQSVTNAAIAGAAGLDTNFDPETGEVSVCAGN